MVYQVRELDDDGRIEALRLRAAQRGLQLPYETSEYLLKRMPRDLRSLFEILDQLDEASLPLSGASPFPSFAMRSRSTQEQNHSAEPGENQQQAHGGHPARGGVDQ